MLIAALNELRDATPHTLLLACAKDAINRAQLIPMLWKLITERRIGCDLLQPLTMESNIWAVNLRSGISKADGNRLNGSDGDE